MMPTCCDWRISPHLFFRCIVVIEKFSIMIKISLKFVPKDPIDNNPALIQIIVLAPNRRQAIILFNADPNQWRIYAALGGDELIIYQYWFRSGNKPLYQPLLTECYDAIWHHQATMS